MTPKRRGAFRPRTGCATWGAQLPDGVSHLVENGARAPGTLGAVSHGVFCINPQLYGAQQRRGSGEKPVLVGGDVMVIADKHAIGVVVVSPCGRVWLTCG